MITKITYGRRVRGLLEYLFGPGRSEEHRDQHVIAGYDDPDELEPSVHRQDRARRDLERLAALLDAPQMAAGERGVHRYVWQCALSLPPEEGPLSDAQWRAIAERFVDQMGFTGGGDRPGCRWVAVRHGTSRGGNDHIHLVVTLATEDGAPVWLRQDKRRSQHVVDQLENEFGLTKRCRRGGATRGRPNTSRPDIDEAARAGRPAPDREVLRREVRAALAGATSEADWVARMWQRGLLVSARTAADDPHQVVGYSVALPRAGAGRLRWLAGRSLDGELSLTAVRRRWPGAEPASAEVWRGQQAEAAQAPRPEVDQGKVWRAASEALKSVGDRVTGLEDDSPEWPATMRSSTDLLVLIAATAEPSGSGPLSRAADILARAAAPHRRDRVDGAGLADELARIATALEWAGRARSSAGGRQLLDVVVQTARLVVAIAELRQAQDDAAAAGAAAAAARWLVPVVAEARHTGRDVVEVVRNADTVRAVTRPAPHREHDELDR